MSYSIQLTAARMIGSKVFYLSLLIVVGATSAVDAQDKSVKPGINKSFENPDVEKYIGKFEGEGRDAFDHRHEILNACQLKPGMVVADVGAGTGLFTRMFSPAVGSTGRVYAVDISKKFLEHIQESAKKANLKNITPVLCKPHSVNLPENSIDVVFICDTYHHFEYPYKTMTSIHRALKPDGEVILVDFHRIEGVTKDWLMKHVRAGKDVFVKEITECGFRQIDEKKGMLDESYFIRFAKAANSQPKSADKSTKSN